MRVTLIFFSEQVSQYVLFNLSMATQAADEGDRHSRIVRIMPGRGRSLPGFDPRPNDLRVVKETFSESVAYGQPVQGKPGQLDSVVIT